MASEIRVPRRWLVAGAATAVALTAFAGTALGATTTASVTVGPVPLPNVPVKVCVNSDCVSTPALSSVKLKVAAGLTTTSLLPAPPVLVPLSCPAGQAGLRVRITTPAAGKLSVTVKVSGKLPTGAAFAKTVGPISTPALPGSVTTISACTTLV